MQTSEASASSRRGLPGGSSLVPQKGVQYLTNHCPDCGNRVTAAQVDDLLLVLTYFFINGLGTWGRLLESPRV